jgi:hypothetical protein
MEYEVEVLYDKRLLRELVDGRLVWRWVKK